MSRATQIRSVCTGSPEANRIPSTADSISFISILERSSLTVSDPGATPAPAGQCSPSHSLPDAGCGPGTAPAPPERWPPP
ncbi:DUF3343 domain-containing protein, partial [Dysosmobacter welbionis]